ncbi:MAG TPA: hypothetical protein VIL71_13845 [Spirillospora sp.]
MGGDALFSSDVPREAVTVDVGRVHARQMIVGGLAAGAFGAIGIIASITGNVEGGTGVRVTAFVLGLVFSAIGLLPLLMRRIALRPRRLVFDADGVRWEDPRGTPWTVNWTDLAEVAFFHSKPDTGRPGLRPRVTLQLRPAEPAFHDDHPEMRHLAVDTGGQAGVVYRLPLTPAQSTVGPIDEALRVFAPGLYHPVGPELPVRRERPRAVEVSVGILSCYWVAIIAANLAIGQVGDLRTAAMLAFWTLVVGIWFLRIWMGGPMAINRMVQFATAFGALSLVAMAAFAYLGFTSTGPMELTDLRGFVPGLVTGGVFLLVARLLSREDVKQWYTGRGQGR